MANYLLIESRDPFRDGLQGIDRRQLQTRKSRDHILGREQGWICVRHWSLSPAFASLNAVALPCPERNPRPGP